MIGCWVLDDVLVDPGPSSCLPTLLDELGEMEPRALLLTHIHLDHAGASGSLVSRWPELEVYVHERGAPHMVDPGRLLESARRLYGEEMDRLWGEMVPVPESRLRVLQGGEQLLGDKFEVAYTPGHASHHVSYLHDGTAFVGDVGGVRIVDGGPVIAPTPPPDIDVEAWHRSIERVLEWRPARLAMTHFGSSEDVEGHMAQVGARLDEWAERARTLDRESFIAAMQEQLAGEAGDEIAAAYEQAAAADQMYQGLERYWQKRAERGAASTSGAAPAA